MNTLEEQPDPLVSLRDVSLQIDSDSGPVTILRKVNLSVSAGEAVGIVGESGSGKSMMLRCIARTLPPGATTTGRVTVAGRDVSALRGSQLRAYRRGEVGMIFQDPRSAINPVHRVEAFLLEPAKDAHGDLAAARLQALATLTRMGVSDPERRMRQYPFELSGGLLQRVMIASVLQARPSLLLADEPTTALDVTTQSDVLALTNELRAERAMAMVFVTHDLDLALAVCSRVVVVYAGRVLETATAAAVEAGPLHPYTRGLLASRPPLTTRLDEIPSIPGSPVSAADAGDGCPFYGRCPVRLDRCARQMPEVTVHDGSEVRCHRAEDIAVGALDHVLPIREAS